MKRFLLKLGLAFPMLAGMVWVNWSGDPALLFDDHQNDPARHKYENAIAKDLLAGRTHYQLEEFSEWIVDGVIFRNRPKIDSLVFGTSIGKPIHQGLFGSAQFYNASIHGGHLEDMPGLYELALDCGIHLRQVLIVIDVYGLGYSLVALPMKQNAYVEKACRRLHVTDGGTDPFAVWKALGRSLIPSGAAADPENGRGPFYPYDELLSPRYFQYSFPYFAEAWVLPDRQPFRRAAGGGFEQLLYPDGSIQWSQSLRYLSPEYVREKVNDATKIDSIATHPGPPRGRPARLFEAFVADLVQSGIELDFLLLPPNPWLYDLAEKAAKRAGKPVVSVDAEAYVRALAKKHQARVRGSLNPRRVGVTGEDYIDDVHLRRESLERLLKTLKPDG